MRSTIVEKAALGFCHPRAPPAAIPTRERFRSDLNGSKTPQVLRRRRQFRPEYRKCDPPTRRFSLAQPKCRFGFQRRRTRRDPRRNRRNSATAEVSGKDERTIRRAAARGEALGDDLAIAGTSLDKGRNGRAADCDTAKVTTFGSPMLLIRPITNVN